MKSNRIRIPVVCLFSILLASALLGGLHIAVLSAQEAPDRHILILIDESGSTRGTDQMRAMDPDARRVRFAEFLVEYMQTFYPQEAVVGITGFVSDTLTIVPMTEAEAWTKADFAAIRPALAGLFHNQYDSDGIELRTRFSSVLQEASESFDALNCSETKSNTPHCSIVLFSDGLWGLDSPQELQDQLIALNDGGIQVIVALLAGDLTLDEPSISSVIRDSGGWDYVRNTWMQAGIADNTVISNSTTLPPYEVYEQIVEALGVADPLSTLSHTVVHGDAVISATLPAHTRFARFMLLPDSAMEETWSLAPDVVAGTQRWWLDPPAGVLEAEVSSSANPYESATVYFSVDHTQYPVQFNAQALPEKLLVGAPIQFMAWFTVNGQVITDTVGLGVDVVVEPGDIPLGSLPSAVGLFTSTWSAPTGQVYTATFMPKASNDLVASDANLIRTFLVAEAPTVTLEVGRSVSQTSHYLLPVTVTVNSAANLTPSVQPTLDVITKTTQTLPLTLIAAGVYRSQVQFPPNTEAELRASLPGGRTLGGVAYGAQTTIGKVRLDQETKNSPISAMLAGFLRLLIATILVLIVAFLLYYRKQRVARQRREYIRKVQGRIDSRADITDLLIQPIPDNPEWSDFCHEFAIEILKNWAADPNLAMSQPTGK